MGRRLAAVLRAVFSEPAEEEVHFHQGPSGAPACCYDRRCTSPRLGLDDVEDDRPAPPAPHTVTLDASETVLVIRVR